MGLLQSPTTPRWCEGAGNEQPVHDYNSENKCVNCGIYLDQAAAGQFQYCRGVSVEISGSVQQLPPNLRTRTCSVKRPVNEVAAVVRSAVRDHVSLGDRVLHPRLAAGMSRDDLAKLWAEDASTVTAIEDGTIDVTSDQLMTLAVETFKSVYRAFQTGK